MRCPDLAHLTTYSNKSDGAGVYASMPQILALRVMHAAPAQKRARGRPCFAYTGRPTRVYTYEY